MTKEEILAKLAAGEITTEDASRLLDEADEDYSSQGFWAMRTPRDRHGFAIRSGTFWIVLAIAAPVAVVITWLLLGN